MKQKIMLVILSMRVPKNQPFSYEIEKRSLKFHFIFRFPRNWKAVFGLQFLFSMSSKNGNGGT